MRLGIHSKLCLLLAAACGTELPPEEPGGVIAHASRLESCSPDVTPPVVVCQPEAGVVECVGYGYLYESGELYTVRDNCEIAYVGVSPVNTPSAGTYFTGVYAEDMAHNTAGCSTSWTVVDTRPPTLTLSGPAQMVLSYGAPYVEQGATGNDTCDIWGANYPIQISGSVDSRAPGTYPITYTAADWAGHVTQRTRLVTVLPESSCTGPLTVPVLALQGRGEERLECGRNTWSDPGALAADECGAVAVHSYNSGQDEYGPGPNANAEGRYSVQYLAWNSRGTASALRTVLVQDSTPPTLRLKGAMRETHTCGSAWVDPGYTALDSCYGDVSYSVQISGFVNGWAEGTYTLTYEARDPGGRRSNILRRIVEVVDCPW